MKSIFILVLFISFAFCLDSDVGSISSAISQIIPKVFSNHLKDFSFIVCCAKPSKLSMIVDNIRKTAKNPSRVLKIDESSSELSINNSAIFLFENFDSYKSSNIISSRNILRKYFFIIFILNFSLKNLEDYSKMLSGHKEHPLKHHQYFLINEEKFVTLSTLMTFQQPNCKDWSVLEINRFSKSENEWKSEKFSVEKFKNYNGCLLYAGSDFNTPPASILFSKAGKLSLTGYLPQIFKDMSKYLNYTAQTYPTVFGIVVPNVTLKPDLHLVINSMRALHLEKLEFVTTFPFYELDNIMLTSRFLPYSIYEKIFMPFETEVWLCLCLTFAIIAAAVLIISCGSRSVVTFVFGVKVQTPLLNMM